MYICILDARGGYAPLARRNCQASDLSNASDLSRANAQLHLSESELQSPKLKPRIDELKTGIQRLKLQISELKPDFISQS